VPSLAAAALADTGAGRHNRARAAHAVHTECAGPARCPVPRAACTAPVRGGKRRANGRGRRVATLRNCSGGAAARLRPGSGFGAAALAGYGAAQRLELLQFPLTFALGSAVVAMVAANLGGGRPARAREVARAGMAVAGAIGLGFGAVALLLPGARMGLFLAEPSATSAGVLYLRWVGGTLPVFGVALGAVFALLGMGQARRPAAAGAARFAAVAGGGWLAAQAFGLGLGGLFGAVAFATLGFALPVLVSARGLFGRAGWPPPPPHP
jgi:hypothetical protein